jgi:hypothetical protein
MTPFFVMLNLFQHPFLKPLRISQKWTLKRVQGDGLREPS